MNRSARYAPLTAIAAILFLALAVLPSALNVPQSNPSTTLEYAPVPPSGRDQVPPGGNLSSLGLASSGTIATSADAAVLAVVGGASGAGKNPSTKRCVGSPPRQTEDPLAPPCVAYFQGDNFGATYKGVTRDDVRIVVYHDAHTDGPYGGSGNSTPPRGSYVDLARPPGPNEHIHIKLMRAYMRYFNDRFQTYGRTVRIIMHFSTGTTAESRRADANDERVKVNPFASFDAFISTSAGDDAYVETSADTGALAFLNMQSFGVWKSASWFTRRPGLIWSYKPSVELRARNFVTYACKKVVPYPVSFSGNLGDTGKPRKLGMLMSAAPGRPDLQLYGKLIKKGIEDCGGKFAAEGYTRTTEDYVADRGAENEARFQQAGVTTVIWADTLQPGETRAMASLNYRPEIMIAGTNHVEGSLGSRTQDASVWRNARVVTTYTRMSDLAATPCVQAIMEVDASLRPAEARLGCDYFYPALRQLFTGIQVAGPKLSPAGLEKGFRAIPGIASTDPTVPACYYEAGDYTCVKDAQTEWWDPTGPEPGSGSPGCWRMMEGGKRYVAGAWPDGDVDAQRRDDDPCNAQAPAIG